MRVLVTGACGWVGRHLAAGLAARGHDVGSYDLLYPDPGSGAYWVADVRQRDRVEDAIEQHAPDAVLHLAARYGRVWCEAYKAHAFDVNVAGTATVAEACQEERIPFVLASSSEVYGTLFGDPRAVRVEDELTALAPLNTYGDTKLMAEKAARRIVDPALLAVWRLNMPYGPGGRPGNSGVPGYGYNALHTWMWQAAHGLDLTVHRGTSRSWTWVGDVVGAMLLLLETGYRGTVNVCSSHDMLTSRETAEAVVAVAGSASRIVEVDPPAGVTPWKQLDDSTIYGLGWRPVVGLAEGVERTIGYMADRFDREGRWLGEETAAARAR